MTKEAREAIERIAPKYSGDVRRELLESAKIAGGLELKSDNKSNHIGVLIPVIVDGEDVGHVGIIASLDAAMLVARTQIYLNGQSPVDSPAVVKKTRIKPHDGNGYYYAVSVDGDKVTVADVWGGHQSVISTDEWNQWEVWS